MYRSIAIEQSESILTVPTTLSENDVSCSQRNKQTTRALHVFASKTGI